LAFIPGTSRSRTFPGNIYDASHLVGGTAFAADILGVHLVDVVPYRQKIVIAFGAMVRRVLRELSAKYLIKYHVVLAYMPEKQDEYRLTDYSDTILPEGIETAPKRFAIYYRNKWMIEQSDFVVTYVVNDAASGAAQFKKLAERKGKTVIELSSANNK